MSETKRFARRNSRRRSAKDNQKNTRNFSRDPRIIGMSELIKGFKEAREGKHLAQLKVRFVSNRPSGADENTDFDIEEESSRFYVRRDQHNFTTFGGERVVFDCPTSLPYSDIKDIDSNIVKEIRESGKSDSELAEAFSMDQYLVNRVRHGGSCPICKWVNSEYKRDKDKNDAKTLRAAKQKHYYSWVMVESVNGKTDHEWVDGEPRILHYKHQIFKLLYQARYGKPYGTEGNNDDDEIMDTEDSQDAFYFYEVADSPGDGDEAFPCEGRSFVINVVKGPEWPTYVDAAKPSKFVGQSSPLVNSEEEYWNLARKIEPLEDAMLRNHNFDTYEKIENFFNTKMEFSGPTKADAEDGDDEATLRSRAEKALEEEEVEEKPTRRSRRKKTPPKEEDTNDDDMFGFMDD